MDSAVDTVVHYCCVCNKKKKVHSFNNGDHELESLAELCLENMPSFHAWYLHRTGKRTYGFLMENERTYFAIADSSLGNLEIMQFLENLRDAFAKTTKSGLQEDVVSLIQHLIVSLDNAVRSTPIEQTPERPSSRNGGISTKVPLLGKTTSKHERKKIKERDTEVSENHYDNSVPVDMPRGHTEESSSWKSSNSGCSLQIARRLWWRHVRIIAVLDVILCLILFGIWLAVCNGFDCIS